MTQQDKELLLKDLCARLPYGVKMNHIANNDNEPTTLIGIVKDMITLESNGGYSTANVEEFKPYLFPLLSITEEQYKEIWDCMSADNKETLERANSGQKCANPYSNVADYYNAHHLDYRGLIPKGLAIDATGKNIY